MGRKNKRRNRKGLGVMIKVKPELIRSGLQTYPRSFEEEQDDCLKPRDKTKTKQTVILFVILILIINEVDAPDPSSGRLLFSHFSQEFMVNVC